MSLLVNHLGYTINGKKTCMRGEAENCEFELIDSNSGCVVYKGAMIALPSSQYVKGDFSEFEMPGNYFVRSGGEQSVEFTIGNPYIPTIEKMVRYFAVQRCGDSTTGWNSPCHTDDGCRSDNGTHKDVTGGWHDANDLRKWVSCTIYGMVGLCKTYEIAPEINKDEILEELQWGNQYFLKMQEPMGYVMNHCGGDFNKHADNNKWTDNIVGNEDDRIIDTKPCEPTAQFLFVLAQAMTSRIFSRIDEKYSKICIDAAVKCLDWAIEKKICVNSGDLGTAAAACIEVYRTNGDSRYLQLADSFANEIMNLQVMEETQTNEINGYFKTSPECEDPYSSVLKGNWAFIGLCEVYRTHPPAELTNRLKKAIQAYCEGYILPLCQYSPFDMVPYSLYLQNAEGRRQYGKYWYRYFMQPGGKWWVGNNGSIASAGVGLIMASSILEKPEYKVFAQRQLDWICGMNPFNASLIMGAGYNNPQYFISTEFKPVTPFIPGAVLNGIGGTIDDKPYLDPGSWQTCEYWTPKICYTMWLMSLINEM